MKISLFGRVVRKLSLPGTVSLSFLKSQHSWGEGRDESNCFMRMGFPFGDMEMFQKQRWWLHNFVNLLNATEFFSLKWLTLCYANFTSIYKSIFFILLSIFLYFFSIYLHTIYILYYTYLVNSFQCILKKDIIPDSNPFFITREGTFYYSDYQDARIQECL